MKYLKLILQLRDISNIYSEENGQGKPWYLSRRFIGVVIGFLGAIVALFFGYEASDIHLNILADNVTEIISGCITVYGIIMGIKGAIDARRRGSADSE